MTEPFQIIGEEMETDILVVDDETEWLDTLRVLFEMKGWNVATASSAGAGLCLASARSFALVLCDLAMPGMSGMDMLKELRAADNRTPFIIMTGVGTIPSAVEAMRFGAFNYITKPFDADELEALVRQAIEFGRFHRMLAEEGARGAAEPEMMLGTGRAMESVLSTVDRIAESTASVLIQGETGTGKSLLAKYIHKLSARREGPFLTIDCGAMPEGLLESELFGHVRGAFTGAMNARRGLLQVAEGGTVFLDEIAELSPSMQVKLLRVLQEHEIRPVGGNAVVPVNVRFISATHRDLPAAIREGSFREDLYYRLAVIRLRLPALRERREDIAGFAGHFVRKYNERYGKHVARISPAALQSLQAQPWKGNIRELENVMERAVLLADGESVTLGALGLKEDAEETERMEDFSLQQAVQQAEREAVARALTLAGGNRTRAAALLGVSRRTLYDKLEDYGLEHVRFEHAPPNVPAAERSETPPRRRSSRNSLAADSSGGGVKPAGRNTES